MVKNISWQDKVVFYQKASIVLLLNLLFGAYIWRFMRQAALLGQFHELKTFVLGMAFMFVLMMSFGFILEAYEKMIQGKDNQ
ncbi:hypothetical protein K1W63_06145 [Weissella cibaria]|uniref:hypothetical protein n=2 Tax=Weissella cibaria TaxID=137591 RepID=UPI0011903500|nr:hypothetical protein [Weissella cibaria]MBZ5941948.1 hypothetical protein [Weissella cibaria]MCB5826091.1 hypothetical protein [Weissella cibaria]MCB5857650.1 hypothetical protein [Weissella cibaria]MCB5859876.1 hypothetical protein [Weissella cibaria]MCB5862168.1 hypothetical protein [Weissella cibaria]